MAKLVMVAAHVEEDTLRKFDKLAATLPMRPKRAQLIRWLIEDYLARNGPQSKESSAA